MSDLSAQRRNKIIGKLDLAIKKSKSSEGEDAPEEAKRETKRPEIKIEVGEAKDAPSKNFDETLDKAEIAKEKSAENKDDKKQEKAFTIESKSSLKKLRISSSDAKEEAAEKTLKATPISATRFPTTEETNFEAVENFYADNEGWRLSFLITSSVGLFLTGAWLSLSASYIGGEVGWGSLLTQQPHILGGFLAGILAPVALLWMVIAFIQRGADVRYYTKKLRDELQYTSGGHAAAASVSVDNEAINKTARSALYAIHKARKALQQDIEAHENASPATVSASVDESAIAERLENRFDEKFNVLLSHLDKKNNVVLSEASDELNGKVQRFNISNELEEKIEQFFKRADKIEAMVQQTLNKYEDIDDVLEKRMASLSQSADQAVEKSNSIRDSLRSSAQDMSSFVGQIIGQSKSAIANMQDKIIQLDSDLSKSLKRVEETGKNLKEQASDLCLSVDSANKSIQTLESNIGSHKEAITSGAESILDSMREYDEAIDDQVTRLSESSAKVREDLQKAGEIFAETADKIEPSAQKAQETIQNAQEIMLETSSKLSYETKNHKDTFQAINDDLEKSLTALRDNASEAASILSKSEAGLDQYVDRINSVSEQAQAKIEETGRLVQDQTDNLSLSADKAVLKIEKVHQNLTSQSNEISTHISQALTEVEEAGNEFVIQMKRVEDNSSEALEKFADVNEQSKKQRIALKEIASITEQQLLQMIGRFETQVSSLAKSASVALNDLNEAGSGFAEKSRQMDEQLQSSLTASKEQSTNIAVQMKSMRSDAETATSKLSGLVSSLSDKMDSLKNITDSMSDKLENTRTVLESETEHLADVSIKAARLVEEAAQSYQKQSSLLFKASEDASYNIDKIREKDFKSQRDSFLSSAKYVLESLHSLSVDLTRSIDGRIQEKTWKAYQAGDVAIFTRQIVENKDKISKAKLSEKYTQDNDFRSYTNRFIRQFEEIYQNAQSNDFGDLLAATFATSDIGKLYEILCDTVAHKNIVETKQGRAA